MRGIYLITNKTTGKKYVGKAENIERRWYHHKWTLEKKQHKNRRLQADWDEYGEGDFMFQIIDEVADWKELDGREDFWIDFYKPEYNIAEKQGGRFSPRWFAKRGSRWRTSKRLKEK